MSSSEIRRIGKIRLNAENELSCPFSAAQFASVQRSVLSFLPYNGLSNNSVGFVHTMKQRMDEMFNIPEASSLVAEGKTSSLCSYYTSLQPEGKVLFLKTLATDYSSDQNAIKQLIASMNNLTDQNPRIVLKVEERLRRSLVPKYQQLFTLISHLENGIKFLVDMRTDMLGVLASASVERDEPYLRSMDTSLRELLSMWFCVGFLRLERISWASPCDMLQKISEYEAVHPIRNWSDLKRRVGPYRRCFVFTHYSMPREPVVVLHVALTNEIASSIHEIVTKTRMTAVSVSDSALVDKEDGSKITTAIFYSITSTQKGLQGVELGNYLIKSVIRELLTEYPQLSQFSSLSPIPGFRDWLLGEVNKYIHTRGIGENAEQCFFTKTELPELRQLLSSPEMTVFEAFRDALQKNSWINDENLVRVLKEPLMRLCARYLYVEKRRNFALNPVANFHLRNGAALWRLNWLANTTPRGLSASCGMMVNYRYYLNETKQNSKNYMEQQQIVASDQILELVAWLPSPPSSMQSDEESSLSDRT